MRPNRKIRIGIAIIAVAFLLWGFLQMINSLRGNRQSANNVATAPTNTVVEPVSAPVGERIAYIRADDNPNDSIPGIPARTILTRDMLEFRDARGADTDILVTDIENGAVGFITNRPLGFGQPLRKADLIGHISDVGVAGALLPGRRAMVIPLQGKNTLHDLVRVGDRVDVVASFDQLEARTVVQDVRVLAVDVFGKDFPQVKIAMRGDYKAAPRNVGVANPGSPAGSAPAGDAPATGAPAGSNPGAPGQAGAPPAATPTPTPTGPPPTRPDPAITIEVTPEQATAISLTQSSGQNLDFLIRSRNEPTLAPGAAGGAAGVDGAGGAETTVRVASTTRARLAPYATRAKAPAGNQTQAPRASSSQGRGARDLGGFSRPVAPPTIPVPAPPVTQNVPPLSPDSLGAVKPRPETYDIPVYADGKVARIDTVRRPQD
jgi:Flp pilus assembly protein CpaB